MRKLAALIIAVSLVLTACFALAADITPRPFAPVQDGYVDSAPQVLQWAPDRLLVQFTVEGLQRANLPNPGEKAAGQMSRTGIVSLDQAMDEVAVTGLRAAFPAVANKTMATDLGTDRWYILDLGAGADVPAAAQRLAGDPNLAEALPDLVAFPAVIPHDAM